MGTGSGTRIGPTCGLESAGAAAIGERRGMGMGCGVEAAAAVAAGADAPAAAAAWLCTDAPPSCMNGGRMAGGGYISCGTYGESGEGRAGGGDICSGGRWSGEESGVCSCACCGECNGSGDGCTCVCCCGATATADG